MAEENGGAYLRCSKKKKKTIKATFRNKDTNYTKHARIKKIIP